VRYVDAGYAIALVVLALYAVSLFARRRRLERVAERAVTERGSAGRSVTAGHDTVRAEGAPTPDPRS